MTSGTISVRRWLIFVVILCIATGLAATTSFGAKAGLNIAMHYGTKDQAADYEVHSGVRTGLTAGLFFDLRAAENLTLGYELLYSMKGSNQEIKIKRIEIDGEYEELSKPAVMNALYYLEYIEIPVLLKLAVIETKKLKLSAISGTAMSLKINGRHKLDGIIYFPEGDGFTEIPISESSGLEDVNMFDFSFVYGGKIEYKARYDLFLEYRFVLGWDYLSLPTFADFAPVELRNQTYSLMLGLNF